MNKAEHNPRQDAIDVPQLALAIRFALAAIILGLSYFSIRGSLSIDHFRGLFADLVGGRPLPSLTAFVIGARYGFILTSVIVPLVTISTLFYGGIVRSFYVLGVLAIVTIIEFIILYHGLTAPMREIIRAMTSTP